MAESGFKGLEVWQLAILLAKGSYHIASELPASEQFGLASQIRRAAVSIPSNIAEGYGRRNPADYARFLRIAKDSLNELETQLILVEEFGFAGVNPELKQSINVLGTKLTNLRAKVLVSGVSEERSTYDLRNEDVG